MVVMEKKLRDSLLQKNFDFWKREFDNPISDWAANLLLYYLYNREASAIIAIEKNKSLWMTAKKNEVSYWERFLAR